MGKQGEPTGVYVICHSMKFFYFILFAALFLAVGVSAFEFNGTVLDLDGNPLNNSVVNFTIYNASDFTVIDYNSTTTNETGWFNFSVAENQTVDMFLYDLSITQRNDTFGHVQYIGQSLPEFPAEVLTEVSGTTFYLRPAGTINLTAINLTGDTIVFNYQIKDKKLGYPVAEVFDQGQFVSEAIVSLPADRNYSIMVFPNASMPGSADWSNFSSTQSYTFGLSSYNATTTTVHKQMNMTMGYARVYGHINAAGVSEWDDFTVVPYLLEPGEMVHAQYGSIPYNLSAFFDTNVPTDIYNFSTGVSGAAGFYNISLPSTAEDSQMILFAAMRNGSVYYGGFHNISLSYTDHQNTGSPVELNFSQVFGLLGDTTNITMEDVQGGSHPVATRFQSFFLINSTNDSLTGLSAHAEISVDYSDYGVIPFTWMVGIGQENSSNAALSAPLLNVTGVDEINVYASGQETEYAPKRVSMTASEIIANNNITLSSFDPEFIGSGSSSVSIGLVASNSSCDVPSPDSGCFVGGGNQDESDFNPFAAIIGGGKVSFLMGTDSVKVHYVNVDMLASGPPDALFEDESGVTGSEGSFDAALQFGSDGPTIYDYILIGIPYSTSEGSGLNESVDVNMTISTFYNDDFSEVIWNTTTNGTSGSALGANYSHYLAAQSAWEVLMNGTTCHENRSAINTSNPCFINKSTDSIWVRLPHFSGVDAAVSGSTLESSASDDSGSSGGGGGGGTTPVFWKNTFIEDDDELSDKGSVSRVLKEKERIRIKVESETHYVGIVDLTSSKATINVSSDPQQETFDVGESHKFDILDDDYYDIEVTLNDIDGDEANVSVVYIHEEISSSDSSDGAGDGTGGDGSVSDEDGETGDASSSGALGKIGFWILIIIALAVIAGLGFYLWKLIDKKRRLAGRK